MKSLRRAGFEVTRPLLKTDKVTQPSGGETPVITCKTAPEMCVCACAQSKWNYPVLSPSASQLDKCVLLL